MATSLVVIGAGGFGRETLDVVEAWNTNNPSESFNLLGVIDDAPSKVNLERLSRRGVRYLGSSEEISKLSTEVKYVVGVAAPAIRQQIVDRCDSHGLTAATLIHPSAVIGADTRIAVGVIICASVLVSTNVDIEEHVHLNPGVIIGHDSTLHRFASINPGAIISGDVIVGEHTLVGAGATVLQGLTIGAGSTVGASSCVVKPVPRHAVVKGVPAR